MLETKVIAPYFQIVMIVSFLYLKKPSYFDLDNYTNWKSNELVVILTLMFDFKR